MTINQRPIRTTNGMKKVILLGIALFAGLLTDSIAQNHKASPSTSSQQGSTSSSSPAAAMKQKGSGKMAAGVTNNGNGNQSPTAPTNTQGSTSQGSASVSSPGGAKGTHTTASKQPGASKSGTVDTKSTSGSTGSKRPTSVAAVKKEARTSDPYVSTNGPQPTGPGKPGTPSGKAAGKDAGGSSYPQTGSKKN